MSSPPLAHRYDRVAGRVTLAALLATLALAWVGKAVCVDGQEGFWALTSYCYSDVHVLWSHRGYDVEALPYREPPPDYPVEYTTEYPPGLAFPAWAISRVTGSRSGFFHLTALTFALAALVTLERLDRALLELRGEGWSASRWRLLGFALSPGLVLFGMQNWDLWVLLPVAIGLAAAARGRGLRAAVWFGIGAAVKWWPALLVVVLLAGPWRPAAPAGTRRVDRLADVAGLDLRPALAGAAAWAVAQLPAIAVSPSGWWEAAAFHLRRPPNWDSTAMAVREVGMRLLPGAFWGDAYFDLWTFVSLVGLAVGLVVITARLRDGRLHPAEAALAVVVVFLLVGKVFSPQFVLWLLPLAVLARVSWTPVLAVEASNAGVWLLYAPWLARWHEDEAYQGFLFAGQGLSVVRTLTLVWLLTATLTVTRRGSGQRRSPGREHPHEDDGEPDDGRHQRAEPSLPDVPGTDE